MPSGLVFDFTNMFGTKRLDADKIAQELHTRGAAAEKSNPKHSRNRYLQNHLSKDGTPEHVYFPRMPYIADDNPNTEDSIIKLYKYGKYLQQKDVVIFLGVGGSYLGSKVLF